MISIKSARREVAPLIKAASHAALAQAAVTGATLIEKRLREVAFAGDTRERGIFTAGPAGVGKMGRRTGHTWRSIAQRTQIYERGGETNYLGAAGTPMRWIGVHEYGGTIHGRPWLAIPTIFTKQYGNRAGGFWLKTRKGNLLKMVPALKRQRVLRADGGRRIALGKAKMIPVLLLAKEVTIPARRPFATTANQLRSLLMGIARSAIGRMRLNQYSRPSITVGAQRV